MPLLPVLVLVGALGLSGSAPGSAHRPQGSAPPSPEVWHVSPSSGPPGTQVTIAGAYFKDGAKVLAGGVEATVLRVTGTEIIATVGKHRPGRVLVSVENPDGRSGARGWAFKYLPEAEDGGPASPELPVHS